MSKVTRGKPIAHQREAALAALADVPAGLHRRDVGKAIGLSPDRARDVLHSLRNDGLVFVTAQGGIYGRWALTKHREAALAQLALHRNPAKRPKRIGRPPRPLPAPPPISVFHWRP
jgi:hypothetical protein